MHTRNMAEKDAGVVAKLCTELGYPASEDQIRWRFRALTGVEDHKLLVVQDDGGNVMGWLHAHVPRLLQTDAVAEIQGLVVDETHRGGGFGRLLMTEAELWAKEKRCNEVSLRSSVARQDAHRFYEGMGCQIRTTSHDFRKSLEGHAPGNSTTSWTAQLRHRGDRQV